MDDTKDNKKYYAPFYLDTIYSIDDFDLHIKSIDSELDKKSKAFLSAVKNSDIDVNDVDFPKNISEDVQKMGEDLFQYFSCQHPQEINAILAELIDFSGHKADHVHICTAEEKREIKKAVDLGLKKTNLTLTLQQKNILYQDYIKMIEQGIALINTPKN